MAQKRHLALYMHPADPEAVQHVPYTQGALVRRHEQKLWEMMGLIQSMGATVCKLAQTVAPIPIVFHNFLCFALYLPFFPSFGCGV